MHVMKPDNQTLQFSGRVIRVTTDEVVLPNGHRALLEVVHHPGGAAAVALDAAGELQGLFVGFHDAHPSPCRQCSCTKGYS